MPSVGISAGPLPAGHNAPARPMGKRPNRWPRLHQALALYFLPKAK